MRQDNLNPILEDTWRLSTEQDVSPPPAPNGQPSPDPFYSILRPQASTRYAIYAFPPSIKLPSRHISVYHPIQTDTTRNGAKWASFDDTRSTLDVRLTTVYKRRREDFNQVGGGIHKLSRLRRVFNGLIKRRQHRNTGFSFGNG
jgi:hypothetical protein